MDRAVIHDSVSPHIIGRQGFKLMRDFREFALARIDGNLSVRKVDILILREAYSPCKHVLHSSPCGSAQFDGRLCHITCIQGRDLHRSPYDTVRIA